MKKKENPNAKALQEAWSYVRSHPLLEAMADRYGGAEDPGLSGLLVMGTRGLPTINPKIKATPQEWVWAIAHGYVHLGMGHVCVDKFEDLANCNEVNRFLENLKIGTRPQWVSQPSDLSREDLIRWLKSNQQLPTWGTARQDKDIVTQKEDTWSWRAKNIKNEELFEIGLRRAVAAAIAVASGEIEDINSRRALKSAHIQAMEWFSSNYPLMGGLALKLRVVDDPDLLEKLRVTIAAVDASKGEIYLNKESNLTLGQWRFVIAHEILHVGLGHDLRRQGREPYLWNVATDFVINAWLAEMGVGEMPKGILYDPKLKGLSAEEIYRRITTDTRHYRKLMTLRGVGIEDIIGKRALGPEADTADLDDHYRRALAEGLDIHIKQERGLIPAGLVEEIKALEKPPVPWKVQLARWFEEHFPQEDPERTYARASRRQSSSPDIPRPGKRMKDEDVTTRTFAVVLDTSGSMTRKELGEALGSIASYANAREVNWVRLVFCDAVEYDQGYIRPQDIAGRVKIQGRGGTELQGAIDLVQEAKDFPQDGPILIVTDGGVEPNLQVKREHAFLVTQKGRLPFKPRGPVFYMS